MFSLKIRSFKVLIIKAIYGHNQISSRDVYTNGQTNSNSEAMQFYNESETTKHELQAILIIYESKSK